jgi:acyl dehydratase
VKYPEILSIIPAPGSFSYGADYTIRYALGLGLGAVADELPFVYERQLQAMPTMAVMMSAGSRDYITAGGIDFAQIVHGEQRLTIHQPLPATGSMTSTSHIVSVIDKGSEKGALVNVASSITNAASGVHHATATTTLFCRGDGGCGAPADGELPVHCAPDRPHDLAVMIQTSPQQAALYRLSGDKNPLHIDPEVARAAGFPGPILHGLCSYGIAARAILRAYCDNDPAKIAQFDVRFSSPVYPGESITTHIWRDGPELSFECVVAERGVTVIRNGLCLLRQ